MTPDQRPVAVLAALDEEAVALARCLAPSKAASPGLPLWEGTLEGAPVMLVVAGVGKVAAALAAQFICDARRPRCLLSIGLAGSTGDQHARGSLIVASGAIQHDVDVRPITKARGTLAGLGVTLFPADPALAERLRRAAGQVVENPRIVSSGVILTGDQIVISRDVRDRLAADFPDGSCLDMETAAIAQVALRNGVPWGGLRITSDAADENFNLEEVLGFGAGTASELFAKIIRAFLMEVV